MQRREFLKHLGTGLVVWQTPSIFAEISIKDQSKKLIWIVLRGGVDSIHTIVPVFDKHLSRLRPGLAPTIADKLLPIDRGFGLHPSLVNLHKMYQQKEFLPIVAVHSGYPKRSHFDGQDYLESGKSTIDHDSGWLARAIEQKQLQAMAINNSIPVSLRGSEKVMTWYPSNLKQSSPDIYQQLMALYQDDELLLSRLKEGLEVKAMTGMESLKKRRAKFTDLTKACTKLMSGNKAIDCAMLELGGWDTHNNQKNRLANRLKQLDDGLLVLKQGLGSEWNNTVVVMATEYGRTDREDGTGGTDHGTASTLMLAGGAVSGGQVIGKWPGLAKDQLFNGRDLMPTTNTFGWISSILEQHWNLDPQQLEHIFPEVKPYKVNLIRSKA